MLNESTIAIIKATAPMIRDHGEAITTKMYEILFEKYPQTKPLFARAPKNQPQILARSIMAYCEHIDNLDALKDSIEKIAHKHVATDVHAGYYPMVGHSLLLAIKEVLGDAATNEIVKAWKDAYFFLADVLINREHQLFTEKKKQPLVTE
jgi:nitric oxide dioxygenase